MKEKELLEKIDDLIVQATEERSHHYTESVLKEARHYILEQSVKIDKLRDMLGI